MSVEAMVNVSTTPWQRLERLSVAFAYDLRLTIVTELFLREMSPSQFYAEFGGGSPARVERHFKKLAEHGWLRLVREESGGRRRGGREHFYRSTELAIFDLDAWSLLPYSIKVAFSWTIFKQLSEKVRDAFEAGTFNARADRQLNSTSLLLDRLGRERVLAELTELFEDLLEEQDEARLRIFESGEKPLLATIGVAGFDSPSAPASLEDGSPLPEGTECLAPIYHRLSKVIGDEVCLRIVSELNRREMGVSQYHEEIGGASRSAIRYRFEMLDGLGCLAKIGKMPRDGRRGPREHVYRAAGPVLSDGDVWSGASDSVRATDSWKSFGRISALVKEAIMAGTFDAHPDRHLTWLLLFLDQIGWERSIAAIEESRTFIAEEEERAVLRLADSGDTPIRLTVAVLAFESPQGVGLAP